MSLPTLSSSSSDRNPIPLNLPGNKSTFIVAIPCYHDNSYKIIEQNHEWLSADGISARPGNHKVFRKKINSEQEFNKLESIIQSLRLVKSELFIDREYHPKPEHQKTGDYIDEFIKNKSVSTHYTFQKYYRITVFPYGFDTNMHIPTEEEDKEGKRKIMDLLALRQEYLIVPLLIILKKGKTFDQMKMLSYNSDGSYTVQRVNPTHFYKMPELEEEQEKELEEKDPVKEKGKLDLEEEMDELMGQAYTNGL